MDDQSILKQLNLSEEDLKDLLAKHQAFLASLNPSQLAAVKASLPTAEQASKSLGPSAEELTKFVNTRLGKAQPSATLMFFVAPAK